MSQGGSPPPLRVEQALRLLPDVDALAPLRTFLISLSQSRPGIEPHGTVGKRLLRVEDLREALPLMLETLMAHSKAIINAALDALEAEQGGDMPGVVRAMLPAGRREEEIGRYPQAREWYGHALRVAEGLRDRRPEIESLLHLAHLEAAPRGDSEQAARLYERAYRLAEAEDDHNGAAMACQGQGDVAQSLGRWQGAESWYQKGLKYAGDNALRAAYLYLGLGEVARGRGLLEVAEERLGRARELFESASHQPGRVLTLNAWGLLEKEMGRNAEAIASWHDALAELHRGGGDSRLEMQIRLNMCWLYLDWGRYAEAEDEARKAEMLAITNNYGDSLARLYLIMGKLRGKQNDEAGFIFFEQALEQCQGATPAPRLEMEVYREYGLFKFELGEREEAIDYLGRAREIAESSRDEAFLIKVENELEHMRVGA